MPVCSAPAAAVADSPGQQRGRPAQRRGTLQAQPPPPATRRAARGAERRRAARPQQRARRRAPQRRTPSRPACRLGRCACATPAAAEVARGRRAGGCIPRLQQRPATQHLFHSSEVLPSHHRRPPAPRGRSSGSGRAPRPVAPRPGHASGCQPRATAGQLQPVRPPLLLPRLQPAVEPWLLQMLLRRTLQGHPSLGGRRHPRRRPLAPRSYRWTAAAAPQTAEGRWEGGGVG